MKALLRVACIVSMAVVSVGCASSGNTMGASPPEKAVDPDTLVVDAVYVARIERSARSRGAVIRWVNAPVRRAGEARQ